MASGSRSQKGKAQLREQVLPYVRDYLLIADADARWPGDLFFRSREEHGDIFMLETFRLKRVGDPTRLLVSVVPGLNGCVSALHDRARTHQGEHCAFHRVSPT